MKNNLFIISLFLLFFSLSCKKEDISKTTFKMIKIKEIPQHKWDQLNKKRIYFGHQSVGYNMVEGLEILLKENPNIKLNIQKGKTLSLFKIPIFAHDNNGSNKDPKSKIDEFYSTIDQIGSKVDYAGFKFCYVDFEKGIDVNKIFNYYKQRMNELSLKYPNLTLIHYTVPLKSLQSGPKAIVKKILGKDIGIEDNIVRNEFNDLLRKEYSNHFIFDLAKFESTSPNGERSFSEVNGKKIYTMLPAYTNDGGHLSKTGKKKIGEEYLIFLANTCSKKID